MRDTPTLGIPFDWYVNPDVLAMERRHIFRGSWQYVGHVSMLPGAGSYVTHMLAGTIPIVVVRGDDLQLRGFFNACTHRGARILPSAGEGRADRLTCPYHAWAWALDGSLVNAPYSNQDPTFDASSCPLSPVAVDTWGPLVFANTDPDPATSLADWLGPIPARLAEAGVDIDKLVLWKRFAEYSWAVNWKLIAENFPECYHCAPTHKGLNTILDINPTHESRFAGGHSVLVVNPASQGVLACGQVGAGATYDAVGAVREALYGIVFPNTAIATSPGRPNLSISWLVPESVDRTVFMTDMFFAPDEDEAWIGQLMDWYQIVGDEDEFVCFAVQQGAASGHVPRGRLLPTDELPARFQRLVSDALSPHLG